MMWSFELLRAFVYKDFTVRYKNTALGFLWSLANPILFAAVFYVVFKHVLVNREPNYLAFLLAGLFPWQWFVQTVNGSPSVFLANAGLLKKVPFPRLLLPLASMCSNMIHFALALAVSLPILALSGHPPTLLWLAGIPALLLVQGMLILGISLLLGSVNVYFRDLEYLTLVFTQLLFFITPIVYRESVLPESSHGWLRFNPLYTLIPSWRSLVLENRIDWGGVAVAGVLAAAVLGLGYAVYRRLECRFAESI